jgi:DNA-binding response OmpR family regulator
MGAVVSKTVLIVDDDPDIRGLLDLELHASGYGTIFARDASEAVAIALTERPDLILLDLALPGGDGFTVMERLRGTAAGQIPVIVVTASEPGEKRDRSIELGAVGYFQKPFDAGELIDAVEATLGAPN